MHANNRVDQPTASCTNQFWPIHWSGVWAGALAALAMILITGLIGIAIGAQFVEHGEHVVSWNKVQFSGIIWAVCSAFFSFVVGGWVAAKITGHLQHENAMLHGALVFLLVVPFIIFFAALGAGGFLGGWYNGLAGAPFWANPAAPLPATDAAAIVRNNALGALTALLLGLIGSVAGGWLASVRLIPEESSQPTVASAGLEQHAPPPQTLPARGQ